MKIIGAKGLIRNVDNFLKNTSSFADKHNLVVQVFNADLIYGEEHIISAVEHAKRALKNQTNSTNSLEMEILLYSSGERQLKIAIPKMGVKKGQSEIVFVILKEDRILDRTIDEMLQSLSLKRDDKVLKGDINTLKKFGISDKEISTVSKDKTGDLILEKIAMVDIIK